MYHWVRLRSFVFCLDSEGIIQSAYYLCSDGYARPCNMVRMRGEITSKMNLSNFKSGTWHISCPSYDDTYTYKEGWVRHGTKV